MTTPPPARAAGPLDRLCDEGWALHRQGRFEEARRRYQKVLLRQPAHFNALYRLGAVNLQTGRADEGAQLLARAARIRPTDPSPHCALGEALLMLGRPGEALESLSRAIALKLDFPEAHDQKGVALSTLQRPEEALASFDQAIALDPRSAHAHFHRALALQALGRPAEALASLDAAIAQSPEHPFAHRRRGAVLSFLGRHEEALASYDKAIALRPEDAALPNLRGIALKELKRIDEALASYDAAIALDADFVDPHVNRGFALLLTGRFEAAWPEYEWRKRRWESKWSAAVRQFDPASAWLGDQDLTGKSLFVYYEYGVGDTIQFLRYINILEYLGVNVSVSVQDALKPLVESIVSTAKVLGEDQRPAHFDYHCGLLSLPLALRRILPTIPSPPRLLSADPARRADFSARLGPKTKPRIGLAWSGNPDHPDDVHRSMTFQSLSPLLGECAEWVSLQKEIRPSDVPAFTSDGRVSFHGDELNDFGDTAALLDLMDVVVAVDTSVAHLAGAMGKPVWVLLPFSPDWRWMLGRSDSPWYPSARLFRQPRAGDWESVIAAVKTALAVAPP